MAEVLDAPQTQPAAPTKPGEGFTESMSSLESLFPQVDEPAAPPEPKAEPPAKPQASPKAPEQAKEAPKEIPRDQKPPTPPEQPVKAKTLKEAKEMAEARAKSLESKYAELQKKHEELQKNAAPKEDPRLKDYETRYETAQKRLSELEQELKYADYSRSEEYKTKYESPFLEAYGAARSKIANLKVREGYQVDSEGNVVNPGTWRAGTAADFDTLMRIPDDGDAADFAERQFGNKASVAMYHRERVQELHQGAARAREEYRTKGSEIMKQRAEQMASISKEAAQAWEAENNAAMEKYPQWFKPEDGDQKGNALLEKGMDLANRMFDGRAEQMNHKERARLHSAIRNKAGGFDRLAYKNTQMAKEITALKEKLAQYEDSEPSGGDQRKDKPKEDRPSNMDGVVATLDALVRPYGTP